MLNPRKEEKGIARVFFWRHLIEDQEWMVAHMLGVPSRRIRSVCRA